MTELIAAIIGWAMLTAACICLVFYDEIDRLIMTRRKKRDKKNRRDDGKGGTIHGTSET